ncbi:MAG: hypothetical protein IKN74_03805 [Clostridia bacterium]|nr:hypothetical protein [Clostridia bacterium]
MKDLSKVYSELNQIINVLGDNYRNALPKKLIKFLNDHEDKSYKPSINIINDEFVGIAYKETYFLLSIFYVNYWCKPEDKERLVSEWSKGPEYNEDYNKMFDAASKIPNSMPKLNKLKSAPDYPLPPPSPEVVAKYGGIGNASVNNNFPSPSDFTSEPSVDVKTTNVNTEPDEPHPEVNMNVELDTGKYSNLFTTIEDHYIEEAKNETNKKKGKK